MNRLISRNTFNILTKQFHTKLCLRGGASAHHETKQHEEHTAHDPHHAHPDTHDHHHHEEHYTDNDGRLFGIKVLYTVYI